MTVGQKEKITYRGRLVSASRSNFLSPSHGLGFGLGETGIVLNRVLDTGAGSTQRRIVRGVTGTVVAETDASLTLELRNGRRLKIRVSDILGRKVLRE